MELRASLSNGAAYGYAVSGGVQALQGPLRDQVMQTYAVAVQYVWYIGLAFSLLGFLVVFAEKEIVLRTELNTEFGLDKERKEEKGQKKQEPDPETAKESATSEPTGGHN